MTSTPATASTGSGPQTVTLGGHPTGLFALFFAEMWERFSYYGMRSLLVLYMIKGFLSYGDNDAYKIYGAYTALVYMTPFFGGMIADKLLGARRAVILGGVLMALGHLVMTIEHQSFFYAALGLLIIGNGFFKPNISTIVGGLYPEHSPQRDSGFTIFYMGINLGAAMAPLICGYVGETYGWHYGFGLATVGMLIGLGVFIMPTLIARTQILVGAIATAIAMVALQDNMLLLLVNGFVALALVVSGVTAFIALGREGLPVNAGGPRNPELLARRILGPVTLDVAVYLGALIVVPAVSLLVMLNRTVQIIPKETIERLSEGGSAVTMLAATLLGEVSTPTGLTLAITGVIALAYLVIEGLRSTRVEQHRLIVIVTMMFFSMLFWAFFEQAGSSISLFTDRNVDRVTEVQVVTADDVGKTLSITPNQEQLGYHMGEQLFTMTVLDKLKEEHKASANADEPLTVQWPVDAEDIGMGFGGSEVPASIFQSANPIFIIVFGLVFSALWNFLARKNLEPSTPVKFALGLAQLGLGFVALWYGATHATDRGMVGVSWLLLGYLLHTTGELCLSPVGLSMVTRLSPARLVSTVMGAWFLATAFSAYLAAVIAALTGVSEGGEGEALGIPAPVDTLEVYGSVFGTIGAASLVSALLLFVLAPLLRKGMHEDIDDDPETAALKKAAAGH